MKAVIVLILALASCSDDQPPKASIWKETDRQAVVLVQAHADGARLDCRFPGQAPVAYTFSAGRHRQALPGDPAFCVSDMSELNFWEPIKP